MKPPTFTPPYDSPIEEEFARVAVKFLAPEVDFIPQYTVDTICGRYIIDFVAVLGDRRVGFECDGKDFHDESRDEWRDAMIIGGNHLDAIYRLRGAVINLHVEDCLHLIARREPALFSERGRRNLRTLTTPIYRDYKWDRGDEELALTWPPLDEDDRPRLPDRVHICVRDRCHMTDATQRHFWVGVYEFAARHGGGRLEDVRDAWHRWCAERSKSDEF